jgi:hypothetical protein
MYAQFKELPLWGQIVAVMVLLVVASIVWQIVVGIIRCVIPLAMIAVLIVGALWLFDKVRS